MRKRLYWRNYTLEFLSIFIAVISAFALNNWSDHRRESRAEIKTLTEISNGLKKDIIDVKENIMGHKSGLAACAYWRNVINNKEVSPDSVATYFLALTRDFISIQNISGYETLKSKGLELIENDSLRFKIISLYEFDYTILRKLEEEYHEMQFHENHFRTFNEVFAPNFTFTANGMLNGIQTPLNIAPNQQKVLMSALWKIEINRRYILGYYREVEKKIVQLQEQIDIEISED